ncbi:MAG: hypothetical protein LBV34_26105 [Nocardiopsaceae bacterium]|jgi:hypothetical protein|nr:hypothetical protein [Nocardiopsaceae bacterium]
MIDVLEHPLVAGYLRDLDAALAGLPAAAAAELSEQLRAHLLEALPPGAGEDAVAAVLAELGPPRLIAEASSGPPSGQSPLPARPVPPLRRMAARARRQPARTWLAVAAVTIAVGLASGTLIFWQAQANLQFRYSSAWWNRDSSPVVQTEAAGATQYTVPIRPGKVQGFAILVYNPSDMTQVITGSADPVSPGAGVAPRIGVSTTFTMRQLGEPHAVSYRAGGPIPPHSYRWVRVLWRSAHCYLNAAGGSQGTSDLRLRVRVGWITRTEDVSLGAEYAVAATVASVRADRAYCQNRLPGS